MVPPVGGVERIGTSRTLEKSPLALRRAQDERF